MKNLKINIPNVISISSLIKFKIKNIKEEKKRYYEKYQKELELEPEPETEPKSEPSKFIGLISGKNITWPTYIPPFDKPIKIKFKSSIGLKDVIGNTKLEKEFLLTESTKTDYPDIKTFINELNDYIGVVKNNQPNIYQIYRFTLNHDDSENIIFNNANKNQIIIWNLMLKKNFCLIWKLLESIRYTIAEANSKKNLQNDMELLKEYIQIALKESTRELESETIDILTNILGSLILIMVEIKNIFDELDDNGYILSFDKIDIIADKFIFVLDYIDNKFSFESSI